LGILTLGAYWLAWNNRASDKVISAILPIGLAAVLGVGTSVLIFGAESSTRAAFPMAFFVGAEDRLPIPFEGERRGLETGVFPLLNTLDYTRTDDPDSVLLYHHLVQRLLLQHLINRYTSNWDYETIRYELPFGDLALAGKINASENVG
jgi:hypothetical protein